MPPARFRPAALIASALSSLRDAARPRPVAKRLVLLAEQIDAAARCGWIGLTMHEIVPASARCASAALEIAASAGNDAARAGSRRGRQALTRPPEYGAGNRLAPAQRQALAAA
jgi:hypothetical protein